MTLDQHERRDILQAAVDLSMATESEDIDRGMAALLRAIANAGGCFSDVFAANIIYTSRVFRCMTPDVFDVDDDWGRQEGETRADLLVRELRSVLTANGI